MRFIKAGLMPIDARDYVLENYAWRYNIRSNGWLEDFSLGEKNYIGDECTPPDR